MIPIVVNNQEAMVGDLTEMPVPYTYQVAGTSGIFGAGARVTERGEDHGTGALRRRHLHGHGLSPGRQPALLLGHRRLDRPGRRGGRGVGGAGATAGGASRASDGADLEPLERRNGIEFAPVHRRLGELLMEKVGLVLHADRLRRSL